MKTLSTIALVAAALAVGCGGGGATSDEPAQPATQPAPAVAQQHEPQEVKLPPLDEKATAERGYPVVPVDDRAEAERLCEAIQAKRPSQLDADVTQVQFDLPQTSSDVTCVLPL